ncbi:MAG: sn-glycerol-3-phosphate ABC transporter ATP-binding protein UgpC [Melioribacteraceae bacterium]|nr:sn-glycerol-3-phosphate ABC transporter ATP-binding protein UgpC [Melioribacteraceae bacterium]
MAAVEVKNISKIYDGNTKVVDNVNFEIKDKEFVVLVGPSGCGKSTTLRMIAGLEEITEGEIYIAGELINNIAPSKRDIAMVFQNYALYPHMTVFENMAFGLKIKKTSKADIIERVHEAANILEIEQLLNRKPKALSGGQKQRVALGRAIVRKPKVFLFDEPLSNLDAKLRGQMRIEISKLHKKLGVTMIYVTHDQTEAMTMGDKIVVMKDGVVQQIDEPIKLYKNPKNKFVAGFIGSPTMNFFTGKLNVENNGFRFTCANNEFTIFIPNNRAETVNINNTDSLTIGVRPEDIIINSSDSASIKANVDLIETLGSESLYHLNIAGQKFIVKSTVHLDKNITNDVKVSFNSKNIHLFINESAI